MTDDPRSRPPHIHHVSIDDLDRLGVDDRNNLYWDDKRLVTAARFSLTRRQAQVGTAAAVATVIASATVFLQWLGFDNAAELWAFVSGQ